MSAYFHVEGVQECLTGLKRHAKKVIMEMPHPKTQWKSCMGSQGIKGGIGNACIDSCVVKWLLHQHLDKTHGFQMEVGKFGHPSICLWGAKTNRP